MGVTLTDIGENIVVVAVFRDDLHLVAQLSVGTGNKYIHGRQNIVL
jgi:hypothetical protein